MARNYEAATICGACRTNGARGSHTAHGARHLGVGHHLASRDFQKLMPHRAGKIRRVVNIERIRFEFRQNAMEFRSSERFRYGGEIDRMKRTVSQNNLDI